MIDYTWYKMMDECNKNLTLHQEYQECVWMGRSFVLHCARSVIIKGEDDVDWRLATG